MEKKIIYLMLEKKADFEEKPEKYKFTSSHENAWKIIT
jgi:hypothetical protein